MTARILVVDDIEPNIRLIEAKLTLEYYEVLTATDGATALEIASREQPDIIMLDVMMPGMDGFETCRRLKADSTTRRIPIVLVTALDDRESKIRGLNAGADDLVTKPIDDVLLLARVKSLVRRKALMDGLRSGARRGGSGLGDSRATRFSNSGARVLVVDDNAARAQKLVEALASEQLPAYQADPAAALNSMRGQDLLIANLSASEFDGLRLAAQVRSTEISRRIPILALANQADRPRILKALELGVDAVAALPADPQEILAHVRRLVSEKREVDALLASQVPDPTTDLPIETDVLEQRPAPHAFHWSGNAISVTENRPSPSDQPMEGDVFRAVRSKVSDALQILTGNHADPRLSQSMQAFFECISGTPDNIRSGDLLMTYRSLQADAAAYLNPTSERESTIVSHVVDVSISAADLIVLYPNLRAIEDARLALEISQPESIRPQIAAIVEAATASAVVGDDAQNALQQLIQETSPTADDALAFSPQAVEAYRTKSGVGVGLQLLSIRNFCAAALKAIVTEAKGIGKESVKEARLAIPRGVGEGVQKVVSGSIVLALVTLVSAIAGPLLGIAALAATFRPIAARAEQIRKAIEPPAD